MKTRIEQETPILPHVVAENVVHEVLTWLDKNGYNSQANKMEKRYMEKAVPHLVEYLDAVYCNNKQFRIKMRRLQTIDQIYVWMEHWFASWLNNNDNTTFRLLPHGYGWSTRLSA